MIRRTLGALGALALLAALPAAAQTFNVDNTHSEFGFHVRHLFSKVPGKFGEASGTIQLDPKDLAKSTVEIHIKAASVNTQNEARDKHLRSDAFFGVEKCPEVTFVSKKIVPGKEKDVYDVSGPLTIHCISKEVTIPVHFLGQAKDPFGGGGQRAGFEAKTTINRKDYNMLWNQSLDGGGFLLGDEVEVTIGIEAAQPKLETK